MKRLLIVVLLMGVLVACGSNKDEVEKESAVKDDEIVSEEKEEKNEEVKQDKNEEVNEEDNEEVKQEEKEEADQSKNGSVETKNTEETEKAVEVETKTEQKPSEKSTEKPTEKSTEKSTTPAENKKPAEKVESKPKQEKESEKKPVVKNEKVEEAANNIIWAQNNRDYKVLEGYLGQNITLNKTNNTLKITNVDYPQEAELLKGIKKEDLEHRFTEKDGNDYIVGFAALDHDREMSYTIDLTMRVGENSWKMLNMQINK